MPVPFPVATHLSLPGLRLAELIAASAQFRTVVGAATPTLAMAKVFYPYADDTSDDQEIYQGDLLRPRALIEMREYKRNKLGTGYGGGMGALMFGFEFFPRIQGDDIEEDIRLRAAYFEEQIGTILDEMEAKVGADRLAAEKVLIDGDSTHLNVTSFQLIAGPAETIPAEKDGKLFMFADFLAEWMG